MSRFLRSDAYQKNSERDRIVMSEFGTLAMPDPCKNFFQRFLSRFEMIRKYIVTNLLKRCFCISSSAKNPGTLSDQSCLESLEQESGVCGVFRHRWNSKLQGETIPFTAKASAKPFFFRLHCRAHGQRQRERGHLQRRLLRQHRDQLHAQSEPREPGDSGEGKDLLLTASLAATQFRVCMLRSARPLFL